MNEDKIDLSGTFKQIKSLDWLRNVLDWAVSDLKTRSKAKNFEQRKKIAKNLENALHEFEISIGLRQEEKEEPQGLLAALIAENLQIERSKQLK
jgi:hypothetical protein